MGILRSAKIYALMRAGQSVPEIREARQVKASRASSFPAADLREHGLWLHNCPCEGEHHVAIGEPCNWCGATEKPA